MFGICMVKLSEVPPGLAMLSVACHTSLCVTALFTTAAQRWHICAVLLSLTSVFRIHDAGSHLLSGEEA